MGCLHGHQSPIRWPPSPHLFSSDHSATNSNLQQQRFTHTKVPRPARVMSLQEKLLKVNKKTNIIQWLKMDDLQKNSKNQQKLKKCKSEQDSAHKTSQHFYGPAGQEGTEPPGSASSQDTKQLTCKHAQCTQAHYTEVYNHLLIRSDTASQYFPSPPGQVSEHQRPADITQTRQS